MKTTRKKKRKGATFTVSEHSSSPDVPRGLYCAWTQRSKAGHKKRARETYPTHTSSPTYSYSTDSLARFSHCSYVVRRLQVQHRHRVFTMYDVRLVKPRNLHCPVSPDFDIPSLPLCCASHLQIHGPDQSTTTALSSQLTTFNAESA